MSDISNVVQEIKNVAAGILKKDLADIQGFSERQLEAIAQQAVTIKAGVLSGDIPPDMMAYFFESLKKATENFANTLVGLLAVTVEKLWNAMADFLWDFIQKAVP